MEAKIKEVQDYFKNKIFSNDFEVVEIDKYTMQILIDSKYNFRIWISNGANSIELYSMASILNFIHLDFDTEEKELVWLVLKPHLDKDITQENLNRLLDQKEELERNIERIKSKL